MFNGTLLGHHYRPGDNFPFAAFAADAFEADVTQKVKESLGRGVIGHRLGTNGHARTNEDQMEEEAVFETTGLSALEQRQQLLSHHVRMVARKLSHALFVFGAQGGLGKSRTIFRTLEEENVQPILINSHITPLALYATLFQYREDQVIFLDDVDSIFGSMAHLGLLRSALWGTPRIVTYGSSQLPSDLPPRFETTSRFIFAANVIPQKNDAFKAVLSRCDIFELSASNEEVLELMRCISSRAFVV